MKLGVRNISLDKSIKAKTTGKINRKIKSINPLYGKKGMGLVNNPDKAIYNTVYNKTSFGFVDIIKPSKKDNILILIFKLIIYMYYLLFFYVFYIPIKWIINKLFKKEQ